MSRGPTHPDLSVVVPVYCNERHIEELHRRLTRAVSEMDATETILVDDASRDRSWSSIKRIAEKDPTVRGLQLERNAGQHAAVMMGLREARGSTVVIMDADLQDPPEAVPELVRELHRRDCAAVFAGRRGRHEGAVRLLSSRVFMKVLSRLCGLPVDAGLFVAMRRDLLERLLTYDVVHPFLPAMIGSTGLPLASVPVERHARALGRSSYTSTGRIVMGIRALVWATMWKLGIRRTVTAPASAPVRVAARTESPVA